jgi:DNA-binding protein H-NS
MMPRIGKSSYSDLQSQIAKLQAKAEEIRKSEVGQVIAQIRAAIEHYRLTAADLGFSRSGVPTAAPVVGKRAAKKAVKKAKKFVVPVRYRDDKGNTWTGRGNKPRWLTAALAEGKKQDDFRVN